MTALEWEILQAALRKARGWQRRDDVISVGIGQRRTHGQWEDGRACIVVKVPWKLGTAQLRTKRRRELPKWIDVVVRGRRRRVRVDVQETRGQTAGRLHGLVGGAVELNGAQIGSVSAIVRTGNGTRVALISGHVAEIPGQSLSLGGVSGTTRTPFFTSRLDHCLVDVAAMAGDACELDGHALGGIASVASYKPGNVVYFNRAFTGQRVDVKLRHLTLPAPFDYNGVTRQLLDLVVTEGLTAPGDSGALLYDSGYRAIGTLVGCLAGESYFLPCEIALPILGVTLC
jgi:hypothetical protein